MVASVLRGKTLTAPRALNPKLCALNRIYAGFWGGSPSSFFSWGAGAENVRASSSRMLEI